MTEAEIEDLAEKCGIYWVSENTAYMHANTMRAFAEALFGIEREECAKVCDAALLLDTHGQIVMRGPAKHQNDGIRKCAEAIRSRSKT